MAHVYKTMRIIKIWQKKFNFWFFTPIFIIFGFRRPDFGQISNGYKIWTNFPWKTFDPSNERSWWVLSYKTNRKVISILDRSVYCLKVCQIWKIVKKFLRAKKEINFQKWLKFYMNMNSRPIFSVLTNSCTFWTNVI